MPLANENTAPMVAVYMICYNCEAYIAQAIEGVLNQQADFAIKLFIGDDASTDGTASICKMYQARCPQRIELLLHPVNIGAVNNAKAVYEACLNSGAEYIAMCEGDDYWTDPRKLQKQVQLLEANPQYSLCFHEAVLLNMQTGQEEVYLEYSQDLYSTEDVLRTGAFVPTLSIVFRSKGFCFPEWYFRIPLGDIALVLMNSIRGDIVLIREKMGVYRRHHAGMTRMLEADRVRLTLESIRLLQYFDLYTKFKFSDSVSAANRRSIEALTEFHRTMASPVVQSKWPKLFSFGFWKRRVRMVVSILESK